MTSAARATLAFQTAAILAVDPNGLGGAVLCGPASPGRDAWLAAFRSAFSDGIPWRRMPPQISEGRLLGGLDLTATLAAGRPVAERGLLAEADGGVLIVPMAERLGGSAAGLVAAALDAGEVIVERDGLALRPKARFAAIFLDEGEGDESAPASLIERVAFRLDVSDLGRDDRPGIDVGTIAAARLRRPEASDEVIEALTAAGIAFGVPSLRVATFALRAAKAAAALAGRDHVAPEDAELAAALVLAPRATMLPSVAAEDDPDEPAPEAPEASETEPLEAPEPDTANADAQVPGEQEPLSDSVVDATRAAIPADLLALLSLAAAGIRRPSAAGRGGALKPSARRGRPAGTRRGQPGHGVRLAIVETLRAAAPWQRLRRQTASGPAPDRLLIRREDFRVGRFKQRSETVTIFVVDASGSAALHRLAEVKGAVELILADCYVRRDSVALIAFRGSDAELILPPTRSLARAKRALAGQAGGGGTPLASAVEAAAVLSDRVKRSGQTPLVVMLTDGKANIARSGRPGRAQAEADALGAAQAFRLGGIAALVLDIAPRPGEAAARLANAMNARYIPLPYADAQAMSRIVLATAPTAKGIA